MAGVLGTEQALADSDVHSGGTFAWVPPACAGALAGIDAILRENALDNVAQLAAIAEEVLAPMVDQYEQVGDVRIAGAFIGIEFVTDRDTIAPAPAFHREVHHELGGGLAYNTVQTILIRLYEKGLVERRKAGRGHRYWPVQDAASAAASRMRAALGDRAGRSAVLRQFAASLDEEDATALRRLLTPTERRRGPRQ